MMDDCGRGFVLSVSRIISFSCVHDFIPPELACRSFRSFIFHSIASEGHPQFIQYALKHHHHTGPLHVENGNKFLVDHSSPSSSSSRVLLDIGNFFHALNLGKLASCFLASCGFMLCFCSCARMMWDHAARLFPPKSAMISCSDRDHSCQQHNAALDPVVQIIHPSPLSAIM